MRYCRECRGMLAAARVVLAAAVACVLVYSAGRGGSDPQLTTHHSLVRLTTPHTVSHERQECQAMFTVDKRGPDVIWNTDEHYVELSHQLQPLLPDSGIQFDNVTNIVSGRIFMGPRLSLMDGTVPYIPCQILQYDKLDVARCSAARAARGGKTWVAFVGDSNQRQKTHSFMSFLPPELAYTYFLGNKEVTQTEFTYAVAHHKHRPPTFDIVGKARPTTISKTSTNPRASTMTTSAMNQKTSAIMTTTTTIQNLSNIHPNTVLGFHSDNSSLEVQKDINYYSNKSNYTNINRSHMANVSNNDPFSSIQRRIMDQNITKEPYDFSYSEDDLLDNDPRLSSYELRVTLVWAPFGTMRNISYRDPELHPTMVTKLNEWVKAEVIPDVIVVGLGSWMVMLREDVDELAPFPELSRFGLPMVPILAHLTRRTRVLFLSQSRYRWFNFEGTNQQPNNPKDFWKVFLHLGQFQDALPLVDGWLWRILRSTGMWHWDSTLPFNLANIRECHMLWNTSEANEALYSDSWWDCRDVHHASYETNHDEIQMLLNLLCNPYVAGARNYCCSVT